MVRFDIYVYIPFLSPPQIDYFLVHRCTISIWVEL